MVTNSMIIALLAHSKNPSKSLIYHIGTSLRNPIKLSDLQDMMYPHITKNPWLKKHGRSGAFPDKITFDPTTEVEFLQNKVLAPKTEVNY